jgi:hypothetical protein
VTDTKLFVEYTDYNIVPPLDVNPFTVNTYLKPIIVCAREGQKTRVSKLIECGILNAEVVGWWDLTGMPIDVLLEHDAVFVLDPERIGYKPARLQWQKVIECLK